eukprot:4199536-Prymnesium_polylepis.1
MTGGGWLVPCDVSPAQIDDEAPSAVPNAAVAARVNGRRLSARHMVQTSGPWESWATSKTIMIKLGDVPHKTTL